jgi:DNA-binding MarR family transcriptional regulator
VDIVLRYNMGMHTGITTDEYRGLAELRHRIRRFLHDGDVVTRAAGLEPQQYLMLLTIRGLPEGEESTIRTLAERVALKHHSAVELIDRLEGHGYVRRNRSRDDRRRVIVSLLPRGQRILEKVARHRISELRSNGHQLVRTIGRLLEQTRDHEPTSTGKQPVKKELRGKRE